jgi:hypothetical protein
MIEVFKTWCTIKDLNYLVVKKLEEDKWIVANSFSQYICDTVYILTHKA